MNHAILTSDELEVVIGNNQPGTSRFADHRVGYNGIWSLQSRHEPANCFVPAYAGLNLEHTYDERFANLLDRPELVFEPRHAPMHLADITADSVVLHQPPTALTGVESWTCFRVEGNRIAFEFRAVPRSAPPGEWLGIFWASYIHAPADPGVCFLGSWPDHDTPTGWMKLACDAHGESANVTGPDAVMHPDEWREQQDWPPFGSLIHSLSRRRYAEPMFYGRPGDGKMMLLVLFEPNPGLRIVQSPSGGGFTEQASTWNPAWDFHLLVRPAVVGQEITLRARVIYKPFESRDEILQLLAEWNRPS